jgi:xanthine dehydrogenase iron-sulfur cluster and FAD-binding subunit A
MHSTSGR